ncbi:cation:proton antiporter [Streptomyces sp. NPDC005931]|uniref:cation:proton antiporter n=1 Tax=Streptomyces sp. NPDC005931 TaxID=3364737 RepID=UPI0036A558C8
MTSPDFLFALLGFGALGAAVLPRLVAGRPLSVPLVFLLCGIGLQLLPVPLPDIDPVGDRAWVEHLTEVCVIVSLMGAGLALNRPFGRRLWRATWRQLGVTMPLSMAVVGVLAWSVLGWPPAAALLLAAVLAPTDPVLASEVRVGAPTDSEHDEDEVRFTLTSEAGLNDGLAFPFVMGAVALAGAVAADGVTGGGIARWALVDVAYKCVAGVLAGLAVGRLLGWLFFRAGWRAMRLSEHREGFVAVGATFLAYGVTELLHGYGFLAVFVTACRIRAAERAHGYHMVLHDFVEQVERLLTAGLLFLLGVFVAQGGLAPLSWRGALVGLLLLVVVRPLTGWGAQLGTPAGPRERMVIAFFGIRGIGSLFYLAYALGEGTFDVPGGELWAVVTFTVLASVVLHGVSASPVISRLDRLRLLKARAGRRSGPEPGEDEVAGKRL